MQLSTIPPEALRETSQKPAAQEKNKAAAKEKQQRLVIKNQIVDIPKPLVQQEPKKTAYVSDWNQSVNEEMVSRHKGGGYGTDNQKSLEVSVKPKIPPASTAVTQQRSAQSQAQQQPPSSRQMAEQPNQEGFSLSRQNSTPAAGATGENSSQSGKDERLALNSMLPSYSRMRSVPGIGDNNYLPGLKQGDVTLLNTKSFVYAGFVRRVAYRIFDRFIFDVRNSDVTQEDMGNLEGHAYVEANMDANGKLLSVKLLRSSGSQEWDRLAIEACKRATWDANPPKGAEGKDGLIHFVFAPGRDVLVVGLLD
jgi:TonB family protein